MAKRKLMVRMPQMLEQVNTDNCNKYCNGSNLHESIDIATKIQDILSKNYKIADVLRAKRIEAGAKSITQLHELFDDLNDDELIKLCEWAANDPYWKNCFTAITWLIKSNEDSLYNYEVLRNSYNMIHAKEINLDAVYVITKFVRENAPPKESDKFIRQLTALDKKLCDYDLDFSSSWRTSRVYRDILRFYQALRFSLMENYYKYTWFQVAYEYFGYLDWRIGNGTLDKITLGNFSYKSQVFKDYIEDLHKGTTTLVVDMPYMKFYLKEKKWADK